MRTIGSTVISRDSIVCPRVEGGSKRQIKEGTVPPFHAGQHPAPCQQLVLPPRARSLPGVPMLVRKGCSSRRNPVLRPTESARLGEPAVAPFKRSLAAFWS